MKNTLEQNRQLVKKELHQLQDDLSFFYNNGPDGAENTTRNWQLLFEHFFSKKTGQPSAGWTKKTALYIELIGLEKYQEYTYGFLQKLLHLLDTIRLKKTGSELYFLHEKFQELFKGLIWSATLVDLPRLADLIENVGLICFKKIPSHGAISVKLGNACLYALAFTPEQKGLKQFLNFRKITYPSVRKQVNKYLDKIAKKANLTTDEIEENVVDDFGLNQAFKISLDINPYQGEIFIQPNGKILTSWLNKTKGNLPVKKLPDAIKNTHKESITDFKNTAKQLKTQLTTQRNRIESFYLRRRQWIYQKWAPNYLNHALIRQLSNRLIWQFSKDEKTATAIYTGYWQSADGTELDWIDDQTIVRLWHPIDSTPDEVLAWRNWLNEHEIHQPFKQAFREVYLLTDAERRTLNYSNRFAAHILKQHQFAALCKVRNWTYKLKGYWENDSIPTYPIPVWNMSAEFWVDIDWDGERTANNAFNLVFTDQVRFYQDDELIEIEETPPIVFSEVMRDVDLFVGVTSIGNDPSWQSGNHNENDYWQQYSFSELTESAKVRKSVLEKIIPRLKIAKQCSFSGRFLIVKGSRKTYKIHLGSGNILMEPNDQYLCIVPDRKQSQLDQVFLPFEGDQMLSIIVSKAFLLANDQNITDSVILEQLAE